MFSYQHYCFHSRLFPSTLKKQTIQPFSFETLTYLCLPLSPHFSLLHSSQDDSSFTSHLHEPEVNCKVFCYSSSILLCILSIHHTIQYQKVHSSSSSSMNSQTFKTHAFLLLISNPSITLLSLFNNHSSSSHSFPINHNHSLLLILNVN